MKKIIQLIKSETLLFVAILSVLAVQVEITMSVYQRVNSETQALFAFCYAFAIELAVLIFVINGQRKTSIAYAIGALLTDCYYLLNWPQWVGTVLVALLLPGTILGFTHLFTQKIRKVERKEQEREQYEATHPYECGECGERFETSRQLNGHLSAHKRVAKKAA